MSELKKLLGKMEISMEAICSRVITAQDKISELLDEIQNMENIFLENTEYGKNFKVNGHEDERTLI